MEPCHVELYALSTCSHCKDTKDLLNQCGIDYDCVDVDRLEADKRRTILEEIKKVNPQRRRAGRLIASGRNTAPKSTTPKG